LLSVLREAEIFQQKVDMFIRLLVDEGDEQHYFLPAFDVKRLNTKKDIPSMNNS
jgi:hypothetical protein